MIESDKFKLWHRIQCGLTIEYLDSWMKSQLAEQNIKVEVKRNGRWVEV